MKIETQPRDDHQLTLIVTLEKEQMESAKRRAARRISERKSIPGFRPGKAPYDMVIRQVGEGYVVEEAVDLLLDEVYPKALEEANVEPAGPGSLEKVDDLDKEPKFTFTVPLAPTVELGEYRAIRVPYKWEEPSEEKVDEALQDLRQLHAKTETVNRPVQAGDFVLIDLKGMKAKAAEDEAPLFDHNNMPVFIREKEKEDEYPYPGFSKELIGLSANESKTFNHKFPRDYADERLRGQTVKFEATVKMVRGNILPELNDEFAQSVGGFENLNALREVVRASITARLKSEYDDQYFDKLIAEIRKGATIKYPPQMLQEEIESMLKDFQSRLARQGLDMDAYLKSRNMDEAQFKEEIKPVAAQRLETRLLLHELGEAEEIEVSKTALQSSFQQTWQEYQDNSNFQKMMRGKSQPPRRLVEIAMLESAQRAYGELLLERLKEIATGQAEEQETPSPKKRASASSKKQPKEQKTSRPSTGKSRTANSSEK